MAKISVRNVELLDYIAQHQSQRKANRPTQNLNFSTPCRELSQRKEHTTEWNVVPISEYGFGSFDFFATENLSGRMTPA